MSPIRPEQKPLYPWDWPAIAREVKVDRAGGRCECDGRCKADPHPGDSTGRCTAMHREPHPHTGSDVVLTVAHLDHDPRNNGVEGDRPNLMAMCQRCHLTYDAPHHAVTRAATLAARSTDGSAPMPLDGLGIEL